MTLTDVNQAIVAAVAAVDGIDGSKLYADQLTIEGIEELMPGHDSVVAFIEEGRSEPSEEFADPLAVLKLSYAVTLIGRSSADGATARVRVVGQRVMALINKTNWGLPDIGLAQLQDGAWDDMNPDPESYRIYKIEFWHNAFFKEVE